MAKEIIFSGIQPSGNIHIGNYLGAIKQFVELQKKGGAIFCIVDEHAITIPQDPKELRENILDVAMIYLACGIDPKKSLIFIQSHVPAHTELGWILNTLTPLGELERMTQFKEKVRDKKEKIGILSGLLTYPTLMAADILLYQTTAVPVGEDQKQHVELTRTIARKFNNRYGDSFTIPKTVLDKHAARIMSLDDPQKKMAKSAENPKSYINLLDSPKTIREKIKTAVTDSGKEIRYDERKKPAISNLIVIYGAFSGLSNTEIEKKYKGKAYAEFKKDLGELLVEKLKPIQKNYHKLSKNKKQVLKILNEGAKKANKIANKTLNDVKEKMGFVI